MTDDLLDLDAVGLAAAIRGGSVSAAEAVEASIRRIESENPRLNAVIHERFERALDEARGPLGDGPFAGVPLLLKDLGCAQAGEPCHRGMRALRDAGWIEPEDALLTRRFRDAGFVLAGRTNTPEMGLLPTTEPEAYGPSRNPWDVSRSTGGSSGGAAAAVASGMVPAAHASDAGGSIRIPASECGLVGLKPTRGLVPRAEESPTALGVDGVLTRTVRDAAAILGAIAGVAFAGSAPPLRVGVATASPGGFVPTDPVCSAAAESVARRLESLGHAVEPNAPPAWTDPDAAAGFLQGLGAHFGRRTAEDLELWSVRLGRVLGPDDVETHTWTMAQLGRSMDEDAFAAAMAGLDAFSESLLAWWDDHDLLVTPTIAEPPPPLGQFASTPEDPLAAGIRAGRLTPFSTPFNVTGQPAISIPASWNEDGVPVGVQLAAAPGREDLLLSVAAVLEAELDWPSRRPPLD